ncbi:aKG-HExxH-type peptide beta-hydroxylase [Nonomuraea typhae]|uniref:aKG-HExxH-type peptide beta-hydroxylase n=1 Tax=Nonomuraea typhae TaxID=2603600 RepID=UPI0012FC6707|nr:HEXXH motif-containing putative peptide modification protein [Nonomuraea typhae]
MNAETVASFVTAAGWTPANQAVFTARYYHTLVGIRELRRRLSELAPGCLAESGFDASFEAVAGAPSQVQRQVLGHPSAGFWVDVAWSLLTRRAAERFPRMHVTPHLREFVRFAAAAALLTGEGTVAGMVRADSAGRVSLPGAGVSVAGGLPYTMLEVRVDGGEVAGRTHRVPRLAAGPELNWLDGDLRLGGRTPYDFAELDAAQAQHWLHVLDGHLATIATARPELAQELARGVTAIVPILSRDPSLHVSGSFREAPGLIALSLGEPLATVEALVHEYGHQKLYAVLILDSMITGDHGEAVHYSPWRPDPRPLSGLLQATYTFVQVLDFYLALLDVPNTFDRAAVIERAYHVGRQVETGLEVLTGQARFSPAGQVLVTTMVKRLHEVRDALPLPPAEVRDRVDAVCAAHRARHTRQTPIKAEIPAGGDPETLARLGLPADWTAESILGRWYAGDSLLDAVRAAPAGLDLPSGASLVADLASAHLAYVRDDYPAAAARYAACVRRSPRTPYFWQCYAFALRHLGRRGEALHVLTHTPALMRGGELPTGQTAHLTLPRPEPRPAVPGEPPPNFVELEIGPHAVRELWSSRYRDFAEATGGAQLPTLIAVARGLKPSMDVWIPAESWQAFLRAVHDLDLLSYVDACFDRHSPQIAQVPPDQLTTTRAAFSATLSPGTEAHVFLARDPGALDRVVGAGWYPLIIDGVVVNKHRADHDKFGAALGYPACCQDFFRHRNNWNDDNTYYAALLNTRGTPSPLCNPFLRHSVFGLVPYMPCSYTCPATVEYATRLRDHIAGELPGYAAAMDAALRRTVLCVSELRTYWFDGERVSRHRDEVEIRYHGVQSLYRVEAEDPLHELLRAGDRCVLDGEVLRVHRGDTYIGGYRTRGDRHGPECPFVISFSG